MWQLAVKSLWCDFKHTVKSWEVAGVILCISFIFVPYDLYDILYTVWILEIMFRRFIPSCDRIYYVLPLGAKERRKLLICRQYLIELALVLYGLFGSIIHFLIYGNIPVSLIWLAGMLDIIFETFSAISFCQFYPEASMKEKGFGIFFGILTWMCFIIVNALGHGGDRFVLAGIIIGTVSCIAGYLIKLYFMLHAHYEKYVYVNAFNNVNGKKAVSEEIF